MKIFTKNRGILTITALFIAVMFLYNIFFKPEPSTVSPESSASNVGDDLLKMHEELQKVTFDQALFSSPGYLMLADFSTDIPPQATGRPNPFNTIGRD